jgi:hypothetical protein
MNNQRDAFCQAIKEQFPTISAKADIEYVRQWGSFTGSEYYSYSWFEALANAINSEMRKGVEASQFKDLLSDISRNFETGDEDVKKCIDVAFVENLFWQVGPQKARPYWEMLSDVLKRLYVDFHARPPL